MSNPEQKIVQYLNEAHASEVALTRVLQSQIAMTPRGSYRSGLEKHLGETRDHAQRPQRPPAELGQRRQPDPGRPPASPRPSSARPSRSARRRST